MALQLSKMGFNMVRLHLLDAPWAEENLFDPAYEDTRHFSKRSLERLDYFVAQLKRRGIYVYLDLLCRRNFKKGDGVAAYPRLEAGAKGVAMYDRRLIELQKEFAREFLTHFNPYTKTKMVDEPAVALLDIINESSLFRFSREGTPPPFYRLELEALWEKYCRENKIRPFDAARLRDAQAPEVQRFYARLQERYFDEMAAYLRGLGLKIPLSGSNLPLQDADLETNRRLDFIDRHAYWDHPQGGFGDLVKFHNGLLTQSRDYRNPIVKLSREHVAGKPFVAGEWNIAWPNEYRAAGPALIAAYALFQDWQGLLQFNYGGDPNAEKIEGNFDISNKPEIFLQWPSIALFFHRRDLRPAQEIASYPLFYQGEIPEALSFIHGIRRTEPESAARALGAEPGTRAMPSDTGELLWDSEKGHATIQTSRTEAFIGRNPGEVRLKVLAFRSPARFASVFLTSLDGEPLKISKHLLLTAVGRSENKGTVYNAARTFLRKSGGPPILMEPIRGVFSLNAQRRRGAHLYALDSRGVREKNFSPEADAGPFTFELGTSFVYEIFPEG